MERRFGDRAGERRLAPDLAASQLRIGLVLAYLLHLVVLGLFLFSVIPQVYHPADRLFWLHQGGDNVGYFAQARGILTGNLEPNKYPLGFPILLLPFLIVLQPPFQEDLLEPVSAFWGLVMFPVGQILLAWITQRFTGRRWLTLLSVLLWTALPLVLYTVIRLIASPVAAEIGSSHLMWAQMLSDGPAALFTLLIAVVYLRERHDDRWSVLLGFLCGFLMLIRLTGALTVGVVVVLLLAERRWRALVITLVVTLITFAPQMIYNTHFFGSPLTSGYQVLDELPPRGLFNLGYLTDAVQKFGVLPATALVLVALTVGALGFAYLWRRHRSGAVFTAMNIGVYLALYSVYYYSWTGSLTRFLIPMYPFMAIIAAGVVGWITARD